MQAKSTLAALFAIWSLIHNPSARVLIVSAGEKQASDVATLIIRLLENWSILCWLRADSSSGDRTSYENYDVHYSLKGIDKSASISCIGITANLQGKRADLLIPDDKSYVVFKLFKFGETLCISIQYRQYRAKTYL